MSEQSNDEKPLTAAAFASPAATRRDMTARVIRAVPTTDDREDVRAESETPPLVPPAVHESPPDPGTRIAAAVPPLPAPGPQGQPQSAYQQPYGQSTGQWAYGPPGSAPAPAQQGGYPIGAPQPPTGEPPAPSYGFEQFAADTRQAAPRSPASWGWRGRVRRMTGGLISPAAGEDETAYRAALAQVQAGFTGPRTIAFVNPKGGASTTTSVLMSARTFGVHRGGGVVAWDNNETRGTLGERGLSGPHRNTARELLDNIGIFEDSATARIGDLGLYLRSQGAAHFDLLASDERPEVTGHIDSADVGRLHTLFQRFYRLILIDTGNNMRAGNWLAAVHNADLIVVTTTIRQDSASSALWMLDALEKGVYGPGNLKHRTITVVSEPASSYDPRLRDTMLHAFGARTRGVFLIPFEPALVDGGVIDFNRVSTHTERAWLTACAAMASALT